MKVLLINGSPHANGCTKAALDEVDKALKENGIETEHIHVGHKMIHGCIACGKCSELQRCVFDDVVNEVANKFENADGIVIGSPVYYASAAGTLTSFLDRLFFSTGKRFSKRMKVGAVVVSARRAGTIATFDQLNKYFAISQMPIATSQYWNEVHGYSADEVAQDEEGLQTMRVLGRNMAFLVKGIALAKKAYGLPEEEPWICTNFIR
ncbi:MAG: flavodoxin family protein [Bacteroidales bacterium]|nr:flavodoxin family protein [Bacteroidales bacterium]